MAVGQIIELLGRIAELAGADVLERLGELLDLLFRLLLLVILPVDEAARRGQEQDQRRNHHPRIFLGEIGDLVAAQILVDLTQEGVANVRGLRQILPQSGMDEPGAGRFLPHR